MIVNNGALILKICNILFLYSLLLIFIKLVLNLILIDTPKATIKDNNITCNDKDYRKSIVQIFRISAPVFTIILSFVGLYVENIAYYILLINAISAIHVLYMNLRNREYTLLD